MTNHYRIMVAAMLNLLNLLQPELLIDTNMENYFRANIATILGTQYTMILSLNVNPLK